MQGENMLHKADASIPGLGGQGCHGELLITSQLALAPHEPEGHPHAGHSCACGPQSSGEGEELGECEHATSKGPLCPSFNNYWVVYAAQKIGSWSCFLVLFSHESGEHGAGAVQRCPVMFRRAERKTHGG